MNTYLGNL